jgi:hypothetical protein
VRWQSAGLEGGTKVYRSIEHMSVAGPLGVTVHRMLPLGVVNCTMCGIRSAGPSGDQLPDSKPAASTGLPDPMSARAAAGVPTDAVAVD